MNKNSTEYQIKYKASIEGYENILKILQNIENAGFSKKYKKDMEIAVQKLTAYVEQMRAAIKTGNFEEIKLVEKSFSGLDKVISSATDKLASMSLPKDIENDLKKITSELEEITKKSRSLRGTVLGHSKHLVEKDGKQDLTPESKDARFKVQMGKELRETGAPESYAKDIESYDKLNNKIKELQKEYTELTKTKKHNKKEAEELSKKITFLNSVQESTSSVIKETIKTKTSAINKAKKELQTLKEKTKTLQEEREELLKNASAESQLSKEQEASLTQSKELYTQTTNAVQNKERALNSHKKELQNAERNTKALNEQTDKTDKKFNKAAKQIITYGAALRVLRRLARETIRTITEMDEALTGMAIVTNKSRQEAWELVGEFQNLARETGKVSSEIASMATKFYQQGKGTRQVLVLTEAAAKAATVAGISGADSINYLTNAINGFQLSASQAMSVSDKFASLAASAATNYEELAIALSKTAAQANLAGMSIDFTLGLLTKGIETTREAPETIGTALKTVIARMRELTDYGKTLEDGMDVNRVAVALRNIGVQMMDQEGQFRDLETVITEVGTKWDTLNKNQQANVAVALAGTRQQSRLIAMMQNFDRTLALVDKASNSYGATLAQQAEYMDGLGAATTLLSNSWQQLITNMTKTDFVIDIIHKLTSSIEFLSQNTYIVYGAMGLLTAVIIKQAIASNMLFAQKISLARAEGTLYQLQAKGIIQRRMLSKAIGVETAAKNVNTVATSVNTQVKTRETIVDEYALLVGKKKIFLLKLLEALTWKNIKTTITDTAKKIKKIILNKIEIAQDKIWIIQQKTKLLLNTLELKGIKAKIIAMLKLTAVTWLALLPIAAIITAIGVLLVLFADGEKTGAFFADIFSTISEAIRSTIDWIKELTQKVIDLADKFKFLKVIFPVLGAMSYLNKKIEESFYKVERVVARTVEELNKLQAELYNIRNTTSTVENLRGEFEELSNKIVKSNEDLSRMKEIIQEINDVVGFNLIGENLTESEQVQLMLGFESFNEVEARNNIQKIRDSLDSNMADLIKHHSDNQKELNEGFDELFNSVSIKNSIRTMGMEYIDGIEELDLNTRNALLGMLSNNRELILQNNEISFDLINKHMDKINSAIQSGSLVEGFEILGKINDTKLENALKKSVPFFKTISALSKESASHIDNLNFSTEELNEVFNQLEKTGGITGKRVENIFGNIKEDVEDAEKRRQLYQIMYEENEKFVRQAKAIRGASRRDLETIQKMGEINSRFKNELVNEYLAAIAEVEKQEKSINELDKEADDYEQKLSEIISKLGEAQEKIRRIDEASLSDIDGFAMLGVKTTSDLVEQLTKLESRVNRINTINNIDNMTWAEKMDILQDYPELYDSISKGVLTAADAQRIYNKELEDQKNTIQENIDNTKAINKNLGIDLSTDDFSKISTMNIDEILNKYNTLNAEQAGQLLSNAQSIAGEQLILSTLTEGGISAILGGEVKNAWEEFHTNMEYNRRKAQLESERKKLRFMIIDSDEYNKQIKEIKVANKELIDSNMATQERLIKEMDKQHDGWEEYIEFIDGVAVLTEEAEELKGTDEFNALAFTLSNIIELGTNLNELQEERIELSREYLELELESQKKIKEAAIEGLRERKEAAAEYFNELDKLDQKEEREQDREDLITRIAALSGATDGASLKRMRDLQKQLDDIDKAELREKREEIRNALIENIDEQIGDIEDAIKNMSDDLIRSLGEIDLNLDNLEEIKNILDGGIPGYSQGGVVKHTGLSMLHGTKSTPETVMNYDTTKWVQEALKKLAMPRNDFKTGESNNITSVTIGDITISPQQMNNNTDFKAAGRMLADELENALRRRGIVKNVRR